MAKPLYLTKSDLVGAVQSNQNQVRYDSGVVAGLPGLQLKKALVA